MAAPEFVPTTKDQQPRRGLGLPPSRRWTADRPGELGAAQPEGRTLGHPGPDQGYALKLADEQFRPKLILGRVDATDAIAGCLGIALRRAALFGRAPTAHDLRVAFTLWGFLDVSPDADLVALREEWFAEVANPHHYADARRIVEAVDDDVLRRTHTEVEAEYAAGWRSLLRVD